MCFFFQKSDIMTFFVIDPTIYAWVILPLLIFAARVCDVSLETIRVAYISRGVRALAPVVAFAEIVIWLLAVEVVLGNLANIAALLAYAGGFATGTWVGLFVEERLAVGLSVVRVIARGGDADALLSALAEHNIGTTSMQGHGAQERVQVALALVDRRALPEVISMVRQFTPRAFYSVEDVRAVHEGLFGWKRGIGDI